MDSELYWIFSGVGMIITCVLLLLWVRKHNRVKAAAEAEEMEARAVIEAEARLRAEQQQSLAAAGSSPPPKETPVSIMEQREQKMAEARAKGVCMYCSLPAKHCYPTYKRVRSPLDPVLRWLGVKQLDRWRVAVSRHWFSTIKAEWVVCTAHQQRVQGLMEEHLAHGVREIAKALNEQGLDLYEYEVSGVHDIVTGNMRELRDARKKSGKRGAKKDQVVADNVRLLRASNGGSAVS